MGRRTTSDIKKRKRTTVYLTGELSRAIDLAYIEAQKNLSRRLDKTIFVDALFKAGLNHAKETQMLLKEGP
jgi:hypothetical protein